MLSLYNTCQFRFLHFLQSHWYLYARLRIYARSGLPYRFSLVVYSSIKRQLYLSYDPRTRNHKFSQTTLCYNIRDKNSFRHVLKTNWDACLKESDTLSNIILRFIKFVSYNRFTNSHIIWQLMPYLMCFKQWHVVKQYLRSLCSFLFLLFSLVSLYIMTCGVFKPTFSTPRKPF